MTEESLAGKTILMSGGSRGIGLAIALRAARDLIARTRIHSVRDWFECSFEVTDERGARVLTVPFGDTVPDEEDETPAPSR